MSITSQKTVSIGPLDGFEEGEPKRVDIGSLQLCVVQHNSVVYALNDICTHGHAFLSEGIFDEEECVMECPLHGGLFDVRDGRACGAPAVVDTQTYKTRIVDGEVYVELT